MRQAVMTYRLDTAGQARLDRYFDSIGSVLGRRDRRESFALYAIGLFSGIERKSVEPIAGLVSGDKALCRGYHDRLLRFVGVSPWSDRKLRECAARYALTEMTARERIEDWIIDDTGFPKQGDKSPGVQRQYSGTLGKTGNCQIGVSVTVATRTMHLCVDMDLYLPMSWTDDRGRCRAAHIPDGLGYRPKWQIGLDLIRRNVEAGVPIGLLHADSFYGDVGDFRDGARAMGFDYAVDVKCHTRVVIVGDNGDETDPMSVETVAEIIGAGSYRKVTWREGSRRALSARFAAVRVRVVTGKNTRGEQQWLLIEKAKRDGPVEHYVLTTLPKSMSRKQLVRRTKQRWRTERAYEDLKGELGLDHFEGRSYPGWQHHVSCVLACYAFLVAERARAFPPETRPTRSDDALARAA
jgi:SRSO17 transposase